MASALDLFVVPLHRRDGQDQSYLPGLHILSAPKRAARGRAGERLILNLTLPAELPLSADQQHRLLAELAEGYFHTPGAVTSALREQAERLNVYFLQRNKKESAAAAARLAMLSIREDRATLAQCGPLHAFLIDSTGIQNFYDPPAAGRGLGLAKQVDIRFYQCELQPGSLMLLLSELPSGWTETTLLNVAGQKLSTLRRRFLGDAGATLRAVLVASQPGSGRLSLLSAMEPESASQTEATSSVPVPTPQMEAKPKVTESVEMGGAEVKLEATVHPETKPKDDQKPSPFEVIKTRAVVFSQHILPPLRAFLQRLLPAEPRSEEPRFHLPRRTMALIALAVPVAVVVLVSAVYLQFGRQQLYASYLTQAQNSAAVAEARKDPGEIRQAWSAALFYAQRASVYEKDAQTASDLVARAQSALDQLDAIARVDFQPALFSGLPRDAYISRMVATNTDLFMLNATDGLVLRAFLTGGGYQLDQDFHCEPGPYGGTIVSPLVDLALLPRGNAQGAALVAADDNGNLIYCFVGQRPLAVSLIPPDINWGKPSAISVENGNLYVLDTLTNAVWIFFGDDYSFVKPPRFFFGAEVPNMQHMLDLAMKGEKLYLLDGDGHLVICDFSEDLENPTTCQDPAEFTDTRPGRKNGAQIADAHFEEIQLTDPPEPSVFLFDPIVPALYQFSQRLDLVRQFQAEKTLPSKVATAFAVTPNHAIFLAFGNEIYIGFMP